ncbi:hypothetical protein SISNIDRAFT_552006 [Sistotremastrum niveocremeum HHB9708]|uniref:Uncharacterized protein n=1 Tax=Sistotremastrum niveocremeum HHB9708 TaxID=1314777 RepID=A0A164QGI5_9AGAM|nr:hypothetical protein SISNIDRAFT_552006 [Sistotremastrum niveocremeum HHB9708]
MGLMSRLSGCAALAFRLIAISDSGNLKRAIVLLVSADGLSKHPPSPEYHESLKLRFDNYSTLVRPPPILLRRRPRASNPHHINSDLIKAAQQPSNFVDVYGAPQAFPSPAFNIRRSTFNRVIKSLNDESKFWLGAGAGAGEATTSRATRVNVRMRAFENLKESMTKDSLHALPGEVHASKLYQEQNADTSGDRVNYTIFQACVKDHPTECSSMMYHVQDERHGIHGRLKIWAGRDLWDERKINPKFD